MSAPLALFFDVFGTLVDWRTGISTAARRLIAAKAPSTDWLGFADAWRGQYQPSMEEVRTGRIPFSRLDVLHRHNLERILPTFRLSLDEAQKRELNLSWHRLPAWPDVSKGLARLRTKFRLAPVSNGNISLMADLARHNDFIWDAILGAEIAGDYKPKPRVYLAACEAFDLAPAQCMMVAAHSSDLAAAAKCGLQTAHIMRLDEYGPNTGESGPKVRVDYAAKDLLDLAGKLGV